VDQALATTDGKKWMEGQSRSLNKTIDPMLCPKIIRDLWEVFMNARAKEKTVMATTSAFDAGYIFYGQTAWNISSIFANPNVKKWRGEGMRHIYIWVFFEALAIGSQAKKLEDHKLKRLFDALEFTDSTEELLDRSPTILITDAQGFHDILSHLAVCTREKRRV